MKTAYFAWEANGLQNSQCQGVIPVTADITIIGYQFNVQQGRMQVPTFLGIGQAEYSVVDVHVTIDHEDVVPEMGTMTFAQTQGTNKYAQDHSGPTANIIFTCGSQVNDNQTDHKSVVMPPGSISIPVKAGSKIITQGTHAGFATNLSFAGVIFYD